MQRFYNSRRENCQCRLNEKKLNTLDRAGHYKISAPPFTPRWSIGEKLGLFKAMAGRGAMTAQQLAEQTGTAERYVQEWLTAMAAGGYVDYDPASMAFSLSPEQAAALADENGPFYLAGAFQAATAAIKSEAIIPGVSARARALAGMSTIPSCSAAANASISPITG